MDVLVKNRKLGGMLGQVTPIKMEALCKAQLDMRRLALLGSIIPSSDMTLRELAAQQIAVKDAESKSWFVTMARLLILYNLPTITELLRDPPNKSGWQFQ